MRSGGAATLNDILELHGRLFAGTRDRDLGGTLRDEPIWIGPPGCLIDDATFVASPAERVPSLMEDLISYVNDSDHPAVLKAAVARELMEALPSMPVLDAQTVAARLALPDRAARRAPESLHAADIVEPTGGNRNRRYAVPDMVRLLRRMTPDGGYSLDASTFSLPAQGMPSAPIAIPCRHEGARSKKPCVLPYGHRGQHRYL